VSRTAYTNNIKTPIETFLNANNIASTTNYIILTKGIPLRISDSNNNSVDSELAWCLTKAGCSGGFQAISTNPFYNSYDVFSHQKYNMYIVTRLDGYAATTTSQITSMIDRSANSNHPAEFPVA
jgi:uncharacterized protein (TIGR03790 family)